MDNILIYPAGTGDAVQYAARFLLAGNIPLVDHPTPEATHLLLDVPTKTENLPALLSMLPPEITVVGGMLDVPALTKHRVRDFLRDENYLAGNAAITAECAIRVAMPLLESTIADSPALVIGWGRIGKHMARILTALGCDVTVAARKQKDLAMLASLGYSAVDIRDAEKLLFKFRLIFNTAPEPVFSEGQLVKCKNCIKIDLASRPGLIGADVIHARGLPGKLAPKSAGRLIAQTLIHYIKEEG